MRDSKRIYIIIAKLLSLWLKYPDMRFFQIVDLLRSKTKVEDSFYLEDTDLEKLLDEEIM